MLEEHGRPAAGRWIHPTSLVLHHAPVPRESAVASIERSSLSGSSVETVDARAEQSQHNPPAVIDACDARNS
jgi:hypothetical protein